MGSNRKGLKDARRVARTAQATGRNAVASGDLMQAASQVVAARLDILSAGLQDPLHADLAEMALMGSEKVEALGASAVAVSRRMADLSDRLVTGAVDESGRAGQAAQAMMAARSPMTAWATGAEYALGLWGRAAAQALSLNGEIAAAQAAALAPIHRTAAANARRLARG